MSKNKSKNKNGGGGNTSSQPQKTVSKLNNPQASQATYTSTASGDTLLFGKKNFMFLLGGIGLIIIGYFLMAGGHMPSSDVWDEDLIYGARRTLIAPIFILAGLVMQVYTIFVRK